MVNKPLVINIVKICMGTGILALPFAYAKGGSIISGIFLIFICIFNLISSFDLVACSEHLVGKDSRSKNDYALVGYLAYGRYASFSVYLTLMITLIGVCIVYLITCADLLLPLLPPSISPSLFHTTFSLLSFMILLPLSLFPKLDFLSPTSVLGLLCLCVSMSSVVVFGIQSFHFGHPQPPLPSSLQVLSMLIDFIFCSLIPLEFFPVLWHFWFEMIRKYEDVFF